MIAPPGTSRRSVLDWLRPNKGRWRWAVVRVTVVGCIVVLLRFQVLAWTIAGHNLLWKVATSSEANHEGDTRLLLRLRGPGARMLVRLGEEEALVWARDAAMIPALMKLVQRGESRVRVCALQGLAHFRDDRIFRLAKDVLSDPHASVRLAAAHLFSEVGGEEHVSALQRAVAAETSRPVRLAVEAAIDAIQPPEASVGSGRTVKVAAIQFASELGKPELNRRRLETCIREAVRCGAKIVVLPETAIQGYMSFDIRTAWQAEGWEMSKGLRGLSAKGLAETVPGPSTEVLGRLSGELGIYLTVPILEVDPATGKLYNTLCLVGPDGRLLLHYRKLHPWPYAERGWASVGDRGLQFVDTPYGRLGLLICYDINFEPPQLALHEVDTLLYSVAWVDAEGSPWFDVRLPRIARQNRMNIIGANWTVPKKPKWHGYGNTCVIDRTGRILVRVSRDIGEEIVYAEIRVP